MREMNAQKIIITMQDGSVFRGQINIGSCRRLSDYFRKVEGMFIVLFEAGMGDNDGKEVYFLNRNSIVWAKPDDDYAHSEKKIRPYLDEED